MYKYLKVGLRALHIFSSSNNLLYIHNLHFVSDICTQIVMNLKNDTLQLVQENIDLAAAAT